MRHDFLLRLMARLFAILTWPFVRYEFRGGSCLADHPTWLLSGNHRSVFDFPFALIALQHFGRFGNILIASEFFDNPVWGIGARAVGAIPVFRTTDPRGSFSAAIAALKEGQNVCIMPEGQVSWDPVNPLRMYPVKTGVSRLAVGAEVPVLPIALVGSERIWPHKRYFPRLRWRTPVLIRLGDEPMWLTGEDHRGNAQKVKEATEALIVRATNELREIDPSYLEGFAPPS